MNSHVSRLSAIVVVVLCFSLLFVCGMAGHTAQRRQLAAYSLFCIVYITIPKLNAWSTHTKSTTWRFVFLYYFLLLRKGIVCNEHAQRGQFYIFFLLVLPSVSSYSLYLWCGEFFKLMILYFLCFLLLSWCPS